MTLKEIVKKEIEHHNEQMELRKQDDQMIKYPPRALAFLGAIAAVALSGIACLAVMKNREEKKVALEAAKDKVTDMTLIGMEKNVTGNGYAGLMFFSRTGATNQTDAMMHYVTIDPNIIERVRHLKLGDKKKISEWKGLVEQKYIKGYSWHELTKAKE